MIKVFLENFFEQKYYILLLTGIRNTLFMSFIALIMGFFLGIILVLCQIITFKTKFKFVEKSLKVFVKIYIDVIRATPIMVQLIFYWIVVFSSFPISQNLVGGIVLGLSSSAWISEIIRSGIRSINKSQLEAGLSLGFSKFQTYFYIIIPQIIKNLLPSFINELIAIVKDTSLISTIGGIDITRSGDIMIANTGNAICPLILIAFTYLTIIGSLSIVSRKIEIKIKKTENIL